MPAHLPNSGSDAAHPNGPVPERIMDPNGLLRRMAGRIEWCAAPSAHVRYFNGDDAVIVDLIPASPATGRVIDRHLCVEFDGDDAEALPTSICLTRVSERRNSRAAFCAEQVLGARIWDRIEELLGCGGAELETKVILDADEAADCRARWTGLAARLRDPVWLRAATAEVDWVLGVEFVPGTVHVVLTDDEATVFDEEIVDLDGNEPSDVVAAVATSVDRLADRHPGVPVTTCPIGVQLGGPVDTSSGFVEYYDKPVADDDRPWESVPLADLIHEATGQDTLVFNDAWALAVHEAEFGLGRRFTKVVLLVVRQGVGAKLLLDGEVVDNLPMEIGALVVGQAVNGESRSIEANSSVKAIVARVRETGEECTTIQDAADAAEQSDAVRAVFEEAGRGLAPGIAAVQTLINPDAWVIVGPAAIVDDTCASAVAFRNALGDTTAHVGWRGLLPGEVLPRSTVGQLGAQAAALAVLRSQRVKPTLHRNGDGR